jgi:Skp family chaperone for outer membrane proteins
MKMFRITALAIGLSLALSGFGPGRAFAEDLKIGYVNFEKIFEQFEKTKDKNKLLQEKKYQKEVQGQQMVDEINKLRNEMQLLNEDMKEKKQKELTDKMRDLRDFTNDSKEELLKERDEVFRLLTQEIRVLIEEQGKIEGYTLIFDDQVLFFKSKGNDMTDQIIKMINEKYAKEKAAGASKPAK